MPTDANFEIASTSKAFTAAAVLLLTERGTLDLDAPISDYLPPDYTDGLLVIGGHDYGPELTLRQLLSHTAGLPDYWNDPPWVIPGVNAFLLAYILDPDRFWTPEEILAYVPGLDPIDVPGATWHYSDTGFLLAGLVVERVTGDPLHEVYDRLIFGPLGLDDTWLHWREPSPGTRTESHRYEGTWDMYPRRHNSADWAGGGLVSTTADLERFLRALWDGALFEDPATFGEMTAWTPTGVGGIDYGLGLFRVDLGAGLGWIWGHDGYGNSFMYHWPRHDVTFTGTLNQTGNDWWPLVFLAARLIDGSNFPLAKSR
jgi:D-alanyl-D-alanine carboxypeptidase